MKSKNEVRREEWLDFIRGIIIILVCFEHACERTNVYFELSDPVLNVIRYIIKTFQMAGLFAISGYLYAKKKSSIYIEKDKRFIIKLHKEKDDRCFFPVFDI